jgi:hypothetical protein
MVWPTIMVTTKGRRDTMYKTLSGKAWRNGMVAGVNAALEQGHIGLTPHDNRWINDDDYLKNKVFAFEVGGIPAVVSLCRPTWALDEDELLTDILQINAD